MAGVHQMKQSLWAGVHLIEQRVWLVYSIPYGTEHVASAYQVEEGKSRMCIRWHSVWSWCLLYHVEDCMMLACSIWNIAFNWCVPGGTRHVA